jgi:alanine dehydrogenase
MTVKEALGGGVRVLSAGDIEALVTVAGCTTVVEHAFGQWARGEIPPPSILGFHVEGGGFHIKAGAFRSGDRTYFAAKVNGNFPGNPERRGLPTIQGMVLLSDAESGAPLSIMDSARVTELRTAAATAVAARYLAREDAATVALIGCGAQARSQLAAVAGVRSLERIVLSDLNTVRAAGLARWVEERLGLPAEIAPDVGTAVANADICITCTTARSPILDLGMVRAGTFVAAVGADHVDKQEVAPALLAASRLVVDSLEQCASIGDLHHALEAGSMTREDVHAELGQVVAGLATGREGRDEITVFDSTGTAIQDVALAAFLYERAAEGDVGVRVRIATERAAVL